MVDLSERRSQFVSSVTHELKTPLTNINMYIEMLSQGIAHNRAKELEYYQILSSESDRLARLIGNVLDLSRLEKNQHPFKLKQGLFDDVLNEVEVLFRVRLKQEQYALTVRSRPLRPFAYDREVMIQVLTNLIENSLKFGHNATQRLIEIDLHQGAKETTICVGDHGPGIPKRSLRKVFDDFYRDTGSPNHAIPGTGIGLTLVKRFISALGGQVTAQNRRQGSGCIITISLPS